MAAQHLIGADFLEVAGCIGSGDNLFHGHDLVPQLVNNNKQAEGATVFATPSVIPSVMA